VKIKILLGLVIALALSCNEDNIDEPTRQENGEIWLSGGLYQCTEQIHLNNGDTLIVNIEDIISFTSGDKVNVTYKEIGINKNCAPGIDCEVIGIRKIE
jgi:hypothetical protein